MTRKMWHTLSQDIICDGCGITVPRRTNNQLNCTPACRQQTFKPLTEERNCLVCNDAFTTVKSGAVVTCSKFCGDVYCSVNNQRYSDKEIAHLMLLNRGFGLNRFARHLRRHKSGGGDKALDRFLFIIEMYKEETKIDLFEILQDPSTFVTMRMDEWIAKGKPPAFHEGTKGGSKVGNNKGRITVKRMKETYARYEMADFSFDKFDIRTHRTIRVYPQFNWGPYSPRTGEE